MERELSITQWTALPELLIRRTRDVLSENDRAFLHRVYSTPEAVYANRLKAIGFTGKNRVLDAGCGFGQWSLVLARLNQSIVALDSSHTRLRALQWAGAALRLENLQVQQGSLEQLPFGDQCFDCVFCYGVIFCTRWRESLAELARVLKTDGRIYVSANGLGWTLHLWEQQPHAAADYDPRERAAAAFSNTVRYEKRNLAPRGGQIIISPEEMRGALEQNGMRLVALGPEGSTLLDPQQPPPQPFFEGSYCGHIGVFEALATKS